MASKSKSIKLGSQVSLHFKLSLENGFVVEDSFNDEPLSFTVGDGSLEPELENSLIGLIETDSKVFHFSAGQVFNNKDESLIKKMPNADFGELDMSSVSKGLILDFETPSGESTPGMIVETGEEFVTVDFNHPLSGKAFTFEVEVLSVN